jgi:glycosyltransferase involved in cell wall biosynthesis
VEDARIKVIDQANAGVSAARNRGIKDARADLIAFLDADDEWRPDFLQTILELRSKYPSCDAFGTRYFLSSQAGEMNPAVIRGIPPEMRDGILKNYFAIASQSDPPLWTSAVAVTGKAINAVGGFPVGVIAGEDLLTWARLAMKFRIAYSTKPCAIFYNPRKVADRPGRIPQEPDIVGNSLTELFSSVGPGKFPGLRQYIALWHRMRAVIFIQMDDSRHALKELMKAMRLAPSLRLFQLLLIASLPGPFSAKALMLIRRLKAVF